MTKQELENLAKQKSNVIDRMLRSSHNNLYNEINDNFDGRNFSEKLYVYLYGTKDRECCNEDCIKKCYFKSFNKGFNQCCSSACSSQYAKPKRAAAIKETFNKKYGVDSPMELKSIRNKIKEHHDNGTYDYDEMKQKRRRTKQDKYGDPTFNNQKKARATKLERYNDENFNNRAQAIETLEERYGSKIHPNTLKKFKERLEKDEIGVNSTKFKQWLDSNDITNASQLESVKAKKQLSRRKADLDRIFERVKTVATPLFTRDDWISSHYENKYPFECTTCSTEFRDHLFSGSLPRCPKCFPKHVHSSIEQQQLSQWLKSLNIQVIENDKTILNSKELDIVLPDHKIAIEYNGVYYHSEVSGGKGSDYHISKTLECKEKGYKLIHINSIMWNRDEEKVKRRLKSILNINSERIYGRKCQVKRLTKEQKSQFLKEYHLQGNDNSQIHIGLIYDTEIVAIMTFGQLRHFMSDGHEEHAYEMYRFACKGQIVGGASKLLSHFISKYKPNKIITFAKLDFGFTDFYEKIGFTFVHQTNPNYYYFKHKWNPRLYHRSNFQKHTLKAKLETFDPNLTEWENMQLNGFDRIWDCGNLKFEWTK